MRNNATKPAGKVLRDTTRPQTSPPKSDGADVRRVAAALPDGSAPRPAYRRAVGAAYAQWSRLREAVADETVRRDADMPADDDALSYMKSVLKKQAVSAASYIALRLRDSTLVGSRWYISAFVSLPPAILLTGAMRGVLGNHAFLFFLAAVVVSATLGGLRAGLLTLLLSLLPCGYFLSTPISVPAGILNAAASLSLFALMALVTCVLSDSLYIARQQADAARAQAENMARRFRFLAQASALLDTSHDYSVLLGPVTRSLAPAYADWATIDLIDLIDPADTQRAVPSLTRVAAAHPDAEKERLLGGLRERFPLLRGEDHPLANALRTGQPELIADVGKALQTRLWHDAEYARALRDIMPTCLLSVPLVARGRTIGVLTLATTTEERRYTHTDLAMARDLGGRVADAIENARLYHEAQREIAERTRVEQQLREAGELLKQQKLELGELNACLLRQATTDGLTGLNNHRAFQEKLAETVERTRRYASPLSLLLLDVDRFKQYNDTYGHPDGDQVLKQVATALRENTRSTDFVARYGGEEFVVILLNTDAAAALQMGERLRQAIEGLTGLSRQVTASFGASTLTSSTATPSELVARADQALYASKHEGRNRVTHAATLPAAAQTVSEATLNSNAPEMLPVEAVVATRPPVRSSIV